MERELAARYAELYHRHWWWRARETILTRTIGALPLPRGAEILDVGCGDGLFFPRLEAFGKVRGIEVDETLLTDDTPARGRIYTRPLGDPEYGGWRFDLITALDVIEHMDDDVGALAAMASMLAPEGWLIITVPAFMVLWDRHDELNHHRRRYTRGQLRDLLAPHGQLRRIRYLFPGLFVPKLAVRVFGRARGEPLIQDVIPAGPINRLAEAYLRIEDRLLGPLRLPFGTSVLAVMQAPPERPAAGRERAS